MEFPPFVSEAYNGYPCPGKLVEYACDDNHPTAWNDIWAGVVKMKRIVYPVMDTFIDNDAFLPGRATERLKFGRPVVAKVIQFRVSNCKNGP